MGIEKEREAFENLWLAGGGNFDNFIFSEDQGKYAAIENSNLTDKQKEMALYVVNNAYLFFVGGFKQAAKAKAVPKINGSIQEHELAISEIKAEIEEGYDLCQDSYLLDVLVERGIDIGKIQAVSEGFVLVPKEPTEKMVQAGIKTIFEQVGVRSLYKAMIEAQEQVG